MRYRCRLRSEPDGQNSVIYFVISKWFFPELSFCDRWSRGTKTGNEIGVNIHGCYKKITREYRLVRDFNFIILYEVSQGFLLRCTQTNTFVHKFSNLSAPVQCSDVPEFMLGFYLVHDHV